MGISGIYVPDFPIMLHEIKFLLHLLKYFVMRKKNIRLATCKRKLGERQVRGGLAITPAQVLKMAEQGLPVTAQMNANMVDGHVKSDFNIPLEERRGIDMAQIWQEEHTSRKKLKSAHAAGEVVEPKS